MQKHGLPHLTQVLDYRDLDLCPRCGEQPGDGDGPEELIDGRIITYTHDCNSCGLQFAHVYGFIGVTVKNGEGDNETWTEYPTPDDPRFKPEDAKAVLS